MSNTNWGFLRKKYEGSKKERLEKVASEDNILYRMCEDYPDHSVYAWVNAKVEIIGRAYQTGIERQIIGNDAIRKLTNYVFKRGKDFDREISNIRGIEKNEPLKVMKQIIDSHSTLVNVLKGITRDHRSPRSFISKYLHFHLSFVPVFDRYVTKNIKRHVGKKEIEKYNRYFKGGDSDYSNYVKRLIVFSKNLEIDLLTNVKNLDYFIFSLKK